MCRAFLFLLLLPLLDSVPLLLLQRLLSLPPRLLLFLLLLHHQYYHHHHYYCCCCSRLSSSNLSHSPRPLQSLETRGRVRQCYRARAQTRVQVPFSGWPRPVLISYVARRCRSTMRMIMTTTTTTTTTKTTTAAVAAAKKKVSQGPLLMAQALTRIGGTEVIYSSSDLALPAAEPQS